MVVPTPPYSSSLNLSVAGIAFTVHLPSPAWYASLNQHYTDFLYRSEPSWHIYLHHEPDVTHTSSVHGHTEGERVHFHAGSFAGWLDLEQQQAILRVPDQRRASRALDRFLAYICMQELPRRGTGLLVHGVGVDLDGAGHLFFGPSGAGKTTLACLAQGAGRILSDEAVVVDLAGSRPKIVATPLWGQTTPSSIVQRAHGCVRLHAIYALRHGPNFHLRRLTRADAVLALSLSEKLPLDQTAGLQIWLHTVQDLLTQIPAYELTFRPSAELWPFLAAQAPVVPPLTD